jgi:hypothetical protein
MDDSPVRLTLTGIQPEISSVIQRIPGQLSALDSLSHLSEAITSTAANVSIHGSTVCKVSNGRRS